MQKYDVKTFQGLILALQDYWAQQGCVIIQPLDMEVGAGTFHPQTFLKSIGLRFVRVRGSPWAFPIIIKRFYNSLWKIQI